MELYNHEEALRAYSPAPVVDHQAWATRPAGNQSHHELLARQRRGSVTKVFQLPAIEFPVRNSWWFCDGAARGALSTMSACWLLLP